MARMSAIYGHLWMSQYKTQAALDVARLEWFDTITRARLVPSDLSRLIGEIKRSMPKIPSHAEFYEYARRRSSYYIRQQEQVTMYPRLEKKQNSPEKQKSIVAALRAKHGLNQGNDTPEGEKTSQRPTESAQTAQELEDRRRKLQEQAEQMEKGRSNERIQR